MSKINFIFIFKHRGQKESIENEKFLFVSISGKNNHRARKESTEGTKKKNFMINLFIRCGKNP